MAADNTTLAGGDVIRDLARQAGTPKTQTFQLDLGGASANAEVLISAGQKTMALSMPFVLASDQTAVPVTASTADVSATGTLAAAAATVALALNGQSAGLITLTGTWVGTVAFEGFDGTTWFPVNGTASSTSTPASTTSANGAYRITPAGFASIRANMPAWTSGSASVVLRASTGTGGVFANQVLPTKMTDNNTGKFQKVHTFGGSVAASMIGLVNSTFYTATAVTDNYTTALAGSGTATSTATDGFFVLASGTTPASSAQITSKDSATYNGIAPLLFLNGARLPQAGAVGVIRRWGAYDTNNGYFFEDNAGTLRVVSRKATVDTAIASGVFNGLLGASYTLDQNGHFFEIEMTGGRAVFMIDQSAVHTLSVPAGSTTSSANLNLPIRCEVINTPGVMNFTIEGRGQSIGRLGEIDSKKLTEGLFDATDVSMTRAVMVGRSAADTYNNTFVSALGVMRVEGQAGATLAQDGADITTPTAMPAGGVGIRGWLSAIWTKLNGTLGVTGTFWQTTQPVSMVTNTPTLAAGTAIAGKFGIDQTTPGTTNLVALTAETTKVIGTVNQSALTKGTQGATGVTTQDLKDAGRVMWSAASAIAGVTAVATEALVTMIPQRDGTAAATATSHTVTAAKRLRITSITAGLISTGATVLSGRISLRIGAAGAATATSPIVITLAIPSGAALAQAGGVVSQAFPDGIEFSGAMQLGVSQVCSAATGTIWVSITGYEY